MRCSKSYYLYDLELVDLFDNTVIEQVECKDIITRYLLHSAAFKIYIKKTTVNLILRPSIKNVKHKYA